MPERITHPFQLMASWFVMLIALSGVYLAAATKITDPPWAPALLVIATLVLALLVMAAVFIMLTKFRPHLQGPREYAQWLQDERRYVGTKIDFQKASPRRPRKTIPIALAPTEAPIDMALFREIATHSASAVRLNHVEEVLGDLKRLGFQTELYAPEWEGDPAEIQNEDDHQAVWIGEAVPARVAILAIKTVIRRWPHLRYLHLSTDSPGDPPDFIHSEIFFGGSTSTAKGYGLRPWTTSEISELKDNLSQDEFHKAIRSHYGEKGRK